MLKVFNRNSPTTAASTGAAEELRTLPRARDLLAKLTQQEEMCKGNLLSQRRMLLKQQISTTRAKIQQFEIEESAAKAKSVAAEAESNAKQQLADAEAAYAQVLAGKAGRRQLETLRARLFPLEVEREEASAAAYQRSKAAEDKLTAATAAASGEVEAAEALYQAQREAQKFRDNAGPRDLQISALRDAMRVAEEQMLQEDDAALAAENRINMAKLECAKVRADIATQAMLDALIELRLALSRCPDASLTGFGREILWASDKRRIMMGRLIVDEALGTVNSVYIRDLSLALRSVDLRAFDTDPATLPDDVLEATESPAAAVPASA